MIFKKMVPQTVEVVTLRCDIGVRYWEDGFINDEQDSDDNPQMPLIEDGRWKIDIDLSTGQIKNWPAGTRASVHYKVCDDGVYKLLDTEEDVVSTVNYEYVPSMLCPKDNGYGDYVIMDIDENGKIEDWKPDLDYFYRYQK